MSDKKYYRNVVEVEILSDEPFHGNMGLTDLQTIHYYITEGDCSGDIQITVSDEEVSREKMAELLIKQRSDPEFLLGDENEDE